MKEFIRNHKVCYSKSSPLGKSSIKQVAYYIKPHDTLIYVWLEECGNEKTSILEADRSTMTNYIDWFY